MNWRPNRDHQRTIRLTWSYFTRNCRGRRVFGSGNPPRPAAVEPAAVRHPILIADEYAARLEADPNLTQEELSSELGISAMRVSQHLALIRRLPVPFVNGLRRIRRPEVLRVLTERRLRPITRNRNQTVQWRELAAVLAEAGLTLTDGKEISPCR